MNRPHLRWSDFDNSGDILPDGYKRLKNGTIITTNKSLCDSCLYAGSCADSDKGLSFANHTICWKYVEDKQETDGVTLTINPSNYASIEIEGGRE